MKTTNWEKEMAIKNIKHKCASCGRRFKNSVKHYVTEGNYCLNCCQKISQIAKYEREVKQGKGKEADKTLAILFKRWKIGKDYLAITHQFVDEIRSVLRT